MLGVMATVTTGLLSPNSYGLNPDQVAAKMAFRGSFGGGNSSDSENEYRLQQACELPKRNKRKNFKPRCSNIASYSDTDEALNLSEFGNNNNNINNNNNNARNRRKTTTARRVVVESSNYHPMDLSKNDSESASTDSELNFESEGEPKIPPGFSIHSLAKPHHHPDFLTAAPSGGHQHQDMREYAVNTMRELLGIYGLTSEVAESISRQLPIAAFSSGKILENLSLGPSAAAMAAAVAASRSPPSQPPTPPSTPLSPKTSIVSERQPIVPSITITQTTSPNLCIPHQKVPLNLGKKATPVKTFPTNGSSSTSVAAAMPPLSEFPPFPLDDPKSILNTRGIFPQIMHFGGLKEEGSSPPPPTSSSSLDGFGSSSSNPLNAMMAQSLAPTIRDQQLLTKSQQSQMDYSKYVKKFSSSMECGSRYCKDLNYREHFHCLDCNSRVFLKKEEMIRHFKWHKKRDESLQHGFMRYSPLDDCSDRYGNCTHNKKQTHYHCIKEGCDKVYISTSDVQMHANYHRKDSAIIQEGFQRFRATEECGAIYCAFFGQRTTHFHCRRQGCRYTFKNKSDMEKHKSYHIKDEQLSRDGFKKFMKNEMCPYENCRFSKVCNHIHCIRPQCNYVLHSSGQLFSHKRKHERKDSELAYRKYKLAQSMMKNFQDSPAGGFSSSHYDQMDSMSLFNQSSSNMSNTESLSERNSPVSYEEDNSAMDLSANDSNFNDENPTWNNEDFWKKYCQHFCKSDMCIERCENVNQDHYHCLVEHCNANFKCKDGVREHARNHEQQEQVTDAFYTTITNGGCENCIYQDKDKHFHCNWDNCREVILPSEKPFRRLEHYKMHEYSKKLSLTKDPLTMTHLATSVDGMFCRKRGRPPKNRVIEVWNDYSPIGGQSLMDSPQAIFTSFKLPKPSAAATSSKDLDDSNDERSNSPTTSIQDFSLQGFDIYNENVKCPDNLCPYLGQMHFHCTQNRCLYVTDKEDVLIMHSKDFHDNIDILDGFEFYDRNVDCRLTNCQSNKINRHFHCTRPNCGYSFVQYSTMALHNQKHVDEAEMKIKNEADSNKSDDAINLSPDSKVVKASGTFYPLSSIPSDPQKSPELRSTDNDVNSSNTLYGPELSCSRPFCKLKRKYHYHCNACNQAFSEIDRLTVHIAKHSNGALNSHLQQEDNNNHQQQQQQIKEPKINVAPLQSLQNPKPQEQTSPQETYLPPSFDAYSAFGNFPANLATQFALMSQQQFLPQSLYQNPQLMFQHAGLMPNPLLAPPQGAYGDNMTSPLAAMAANLNKRSLESANDMTPDAKKARIQNSMRILKDEPVPEGYLRFRFNEDCQYQHCGYREHQTHFHCQRQDCGYSFCDKTRFVQHTARHERLDTLMGGDFQQYRANVACGRPDCTYTTNLGSTQNKASHFHCLKCEFVCTDTNKVVAHRRQHQKLDSIQAAGFEKFTPSQHCRSPNCQHSGKQTHYHCLQCQYAVLGLAQMSAHKYRHMEG